MKIGISGTNGFLGKELQRSLASKLGAELVEFTWWDGWWHYKQGSGRTPLDPSAPLELDALLLVGAAMPHTLEELTRVDLAFSNVESTVAWTKLPLARPTRVFFFSTVDVYNFDTIVSEQTRPFPRNLYGHSKWFCERLLASHFEDTAHSLTILRFGSVFGPGDTGRAKVIPRMVSDAVANREIKIIGSGDTLRRFLYIQDVSEIIAKCLETRSLPKILNVVAQEASKIREVAELIKSEVGHDVEIYVQADSRQVDQVFDTALMEEVLHPLQTTSIAEGLRLLIGGGEFENLS